MAAVKSAKHQRKKWIGEIMLATMKEVEKKVPCKTLEDQVKLRERHGTAPGPKTVLTAAEEDALVTYLCTWLSVVSHSHV